MHQAVYRPIACGASRPFSHCDTSIAKRASLIAAGADMKGTANSTWAAGADARFATGHTNTSFHTTDNATWEITGVQFEVGSNATPFEHRSYGDEFHRCQRYFQRIGKLEKMLFDF